MSREVLEKREIVATITGTKFYSIDITLASDCRDTLRKIQIDDVTVESITVVDPFISESLEVADVCPFCDDMIFHDEPIVTISDVVMCMKCYQKGER